MPGGSDALPDPDLHRLVKETRERNWSGFPDEEIWDLIYVCHTLSHFQSMLYTIGYRGGNLDSPSDKGLCGLCRDFYSTKLFVGVEYMIALQMFHCRM
jgi:hypothetical protein